MTRETNLKLKYRPQPISLQRYELQRARLQMKIHRSQESPADSEALQVTNGRSDMLRNIVRVLLCSRWTESQHNGFLAVATDFGSLNFEGFRCRRPTSAVAVANNLIGSRRLSVIAAIIVDVVVAVVNVLVGAC